MKRVLWALAALSLGGCLATPPADMVVGPPVAGIFVPSRPMPLRIESNTEGVKAVASYRLKDGTVATIDCAVPCTLGLPEEQALRLDFVKPGWRVSSAPVLKWTSGLDGKPIKPNPYRVIMEPVAR